MRERLSPLRDANLHHLPCRAGPQLWLQANRDLLVVRTTGAAKAVIARNQCSKAQLPVK
jgi:hypothetical protein